jgi:arylsulfatase A-like enzyme
MEPGVSQRPNFLVFCTDQLRADLLSAYGSRYIETPNIDSIGRRGVTFANAYVNNAICQPSRATIFTGLTPRQHLVRTNGIQLDESVPTVMDILRSAGYTTHSVGKLHLANFGLPKGAALESLRAQDFPEARRMWDAGRLERFPVPYHGFQSVDFVGGHVDYTFGDYADWLESTQPGARDLLGKDKALRVPLGPEDAWVMAIPPELHYNTWVADRTGSLLENAARSKNPFFLWCSFPDPHHPFAAPEPYASMVRAEDVAVPEWDPAQEQTLPPFYARALHDGTFESNGVDGPTLWPDSHYQHMIALTCGMVKMVDECVGRVLDALERTGLAENTVVMFTSDHGDLMGDHRLVKKGPFMFRGLIRVPLLACGAGIEPIGSVDGLASLLDLTPTWLDLAGLRYPEGVAPPNPEEPPLAPLPGVSLTPLLNGSAKSVRDLALIEFDDGYVQERMRTIVTRRHRLTVYMGKDYGELFDLQQDPGEHRNLWDDPSAAPVKNELRTALLDEIMRTDPNLPRRLCHA